MHPGLKTSNFSFQDSFSGGEGGGEEAEGKGSEVTRVCPVSPGKERRTAQVERPEQGWAQGGAGRARSWRRETRFVFGLCDLSYLLSKIGSRGFRPQRIVRIEKPETQRVSAKPEDGPRGSKWSRWLPGCGSEFGVI